MLKMKLLQELYTPEATIIEEGEGSSKKLYVEGVSIQMNIGNKNKRIYPEQNVEKEIQRYITETLNNNSAWSELDHPKSANINSDRIAARFISLKREDNNYIGKALITNTPMGNIVKGLLESGGRIGTSTRALGSVKLNKQGLNEVQNDFKMITCGDIVMQPSAPDAYVHALMENSEWVYSNGIWLEQEAEQHKKTILKTSLKQLQEVKLTVFQEFLEKLSK